MIFFLIKKCFLISFATYVADRTSSHWERRWAGRLTRRLIDSSAGRCRRKVAGSTPRRHLDGREMTMTCETDFASCNPRMRSRDSRAD